MASAILNSHPVVFTDNFINEYKVILRIIANDHICPTIIPGGQHIYSDSK